MSQFKPNSNIFNKTISDDMAEMGLVTMSRSGMSDYYAEEMDFNVYILLSHGPMPIVDLVEAVRKLLKKDRIGTLYLRVMDSIQRLNNDKQRICRDGAFCRLTTA
jgi:hypothetical protein